MTTTERDTAKDTDELDEQVTSITIATVMCRQHEVGAIHYKQALSHPDTLPSERRGMTAEWHNHLRKSREWAKKRDAAADEYIARMVRKDSSSK